MSGQFASGKTFERAVALALLEACPNLVLAGTISDPADSAGFLLTPADIAWRTRFARAVAARLLVVEPHLADRERATLLTGTDAAGAIGDPRDLIVRGSDWEVGLSCKWNSAEIKAPRLSARLDPTRDWLELSSSGYLARAARASLDELSPWLKEPWREHRAIRPRLYRTLRDAFLAEWRRLLEEDAGATGRGFINYLLGRYDSYLVRTYANSYRLTAFNHHGTLGNGARWDLRKPQVLRWRNLDLTLTPHPFSQGTLILAGQFRAADNTPDGIELHLRIHSASSRIEPSMKFSVTIPRVPRSFPIVAGGI